jgi:hypothetical protein
MQVERRKNFKKNALKSAVGTTDRKTASDIILKQIIIMDAAARD